MIPLWFWQAGFAILAILNFVSGCISLLYQESPGWAITSYAMTLVAMWAFGSVNRARKEEKRNRNR